MKLFLTGLAKGIRCAFLITSLVFGTVVNAAGTAHESPIGFTTLRDAKGLHQQWNLNEYFDFRWPEKIKNVTVAILDVGYGDIDSTTLSKMLPKDSQIITEYSQGECAGENFPLLKTPDSEYATNPHGMYMAQTVWGMAGFFPEGPKFLLYSATGMRAFYCAVQDMRERTHPNLVLFSANWETTLGNFDGTGDINERVNEIVEDGVIWVNTAGNYGGLVVNAPVIVSDTELRFLKLTDEANPYLLKLTNSLDDLAVSMTLAWTQDHSERELELRVYPATALKDASIKPIAVSEPMYEEVKKGERKLVGAKIKTSLGGRGKQDYYLAVRVKSGTFNKKDNLRVTLNHSGLSAEQGEFKNPIELQGTQKRRFEIMDPASANGLTVGATGGFSAIGPTIDGRGKPEIIMQESKASFTDGMNHLGTSGSAAIFAGIVAVLKAEVPGLRQNDLLRFRTHLPSLRLAQQGTRPWEPYELGSRVSWKVVEMLEEGIGRDFLAYRGYVDEKERTSWQVFAFKPIQQLKLFKTLPREVQADVSQYHLFFWVRSRGSNENNEDDVVELRATPKTDKVHPINRGFGGSHEDYVFLYQKERDSLPTQVIDRISDGTQDDPRYFMVPLKEVIRGTVSQQVRKGTITVPTGVPREMPEFERVPRLRPRRRASAQSPQAALTNPVGSTTNSTNQKHTANAVKTPPVTTQGSANNDELKALVKDIRQRLTRVQQRNGSATVNEIRADLNELWEINSRLVRVNSNFLHDKEVENSTTGVQGFIDVCERKLRDIEATQRKFRRP